MPVALGMGQSQADLCVEREDPISSLSSEEKSCPRMVIRPSLFSSSEWQDISENKGQGRCHLVEFSEQQGMERVQTQMAGIRPGTMLCKRYAHHRVGTREAQYHWSAAFLKEN